MKVASSPERPVPRLAPATAVADLARRSGNSCMAGLGAASNRGRDHRRCHHLSRRPVTPRSEGGRVSLGTTHRGRVAAHAVVAADATTRGRLAAAVSAVPPLVLVAITHLTVELIRRTPSTVRPPLAGGSAGDPTPNAETAEVSAPTSIERGQSPPGGSVCDPIPVNNRLHRAQPPFLDTNDGGHRPTRPPFDHLKIHDPSAQPTNDITRPRTAQAGVVWARGTDLLAQAGARMANRGITLNTITNRWVRRHVHRSLVVTKYSTTPITRATRRRISQLAPVAAFGARRQPRPTPPTMTQ